MVLLDDPLQGPRARIDRAESQLVALSKSFKAVSEEHPYRVVVAELDEKTGNHNLRIEGGPAAFRDDWGLLIGESAHNLRAALDNLAWQLALNRTTTPFGRTAFSIFLVGRTKRLRPGTRPKDKNYVPSFWGQQRGDGLDLIRSIDKRYRALIEVFQPYKRGNGGRFSLLFLLRELNDTDKHRLLTVVTAVPSSWQATGIWVGMEIERGVPLYPNAKIGWIRDLPAGESVQVVDPTGDIRTIEHMEVNFEIAPGVLFGDRCEAVKGFPVVPALRGMVNEVSRVVESFAGEF